jgi:integral membrane protein
MYLKEKLYKVSIIEGISLILLLFIAMPLKYIWGYKIATWIMGSIHGFLWLYFLYILFETKKQLNIENKKAAIMILLSVIPFGFIPMKKLIKEI